MTYLPLVTSECFFAAPPRRAARPRATPFAQQHLKLHGPPNSGRSVAEWAPSLKRATDACVLASKNASPAQRGPRRDAQPLHATPLAAVLFPAPLRARALYLIEPSASQKRLTVTKTFAAAFPRAATSRNQRPGGDLQSPEHCSRALKRSSRLDLMSQRVSALRGQQCDCTR